MKTPTARFVFDRKHVATRSNAKHPKKGLVQIVVMLDRVRKYASTGIKVYSDQWRDNSERHIVSSIYSDEYNKILTSQMMSVLDRISEQAKSGVYDIGKLLPNCRTSCISLVELSVRMEESMPPRSANTRKAYGVFRNNLDSFGKFLDVAKITESDVAEYDKWLEGNGASGNTRRLRISFVKSVLAFAKKQGIIAVNPADGYKLPKADSRELVYLVESELDAIAQVQLPDSLAKSRDLFLFQCYTGIPWADLATLDRSMVQTQQAATYINRSRTKTHIRYRTMLLAPAKKIFEKYGGKLPVPNTYEVYRNHINSIAEAAGITKKISSHVGRHTFATWALSHGTPIEIVSKMLGHTKIETTQIYAKVLAKDVDAQFMRLDELFNGQ